MGYNKSMSIKKLYFVSVATLLFTLSTGYVLSSSVVSADDTVIDEVNITVPVSCTLSGVGMNSHNATINNGTYNSSIGETTIKAFCNDNDGFAIYAIGYTDNTNGKNVLASATLGSNYDIATGTATTGNSQWAMKLATDSNATYAVELQNGFGAFHTVPESYTSVAKRTSGTDVGTSATGSTLTTTYQVFISNTQPADIYSGKVKYTIVHPNDGEAPYSGAYLQSFTLAQCAANATGAGYTVRDIRDDKDYTVRYLNGVCWMTQNLEFTGNTLDSSTSNVPSEYTTENPLIIEWYDLKDDGAEGGNCDSTNGYNYPCYHTPVPPEKTTNFIRQNGVTVSGPVGTWYNYAGATAGTITGNSNTTTATYDICPAGWHLPPSSEVGPTDVINHNLFFSGYYLNGTYTLSSRAGEWWTRSSYNDTTRYAKGLIARQTNYDIETGSFARNYGLHIRCIRTE